jgi:hypothetical protein
MVFHGHVKGRVIELDEQVELPDGAAVQVILELPPLDAPLPTGQALRDDPIWQLGKNPISLDTTDGSTAHDRYIYGADA